ncbi:MAG TPA: DUF2877 domain-containing protein [Thermotogota bacterium]|nr:DUF2877 domain-containing protein [Thermotogota bacterium]HRW93126.1 DUF2877 domain-containing protein [Thermotogota bacterium]
MIELSARLRSADWPEKPVRLQVRHRFSGVMNLVGPDEKRYTLLTRHIDFQPRSLLCASLPAHDATGEEQYSFPPVEVGFDPELRLPFPNPRWKGMWTEWPTLETGLSPEEVEKGVQLPESLLGRGEGFTPAGDDLLSGMLTSLLWLDPVLAERKFLRVEPMLHNTGWFSRQMLLDTMHGCTWKRGKDLCMALCDTDAARLLESVASILQWGHRSGAAWLAGLGVGLCLADAHNGG